MSLRKKEGCVNPQDLPNVFKGGATGGYNSWLIKCNVDLDDGSVTCDDYATDAMLLKGEYIWTISEFAPNRMIVYSDEDGHLLFIINNWKVVMTIKEPMSGNGSKDWIRPLPNFDINKYPFLVCAGKETFSLLNVKTGTIEDMIKGSALASKGSTPAFFVPLQNGFEMHFTTRKNMQSKQIEFNYHVMHYKKDFVKILREFGSLPYDSIVTSLEKIQALQKEKAALEKTITNFEKKGAGAGAGKSEETAKLQKEVDAMTQKIKDLEAAQKKSSKLIRD
jgi:hypothetical protein